jgi:hypothetical protein
VERAVFRFCHTIREFQAVMDRLVSASPVPHPSFTTVGLRTSDASIRFRRDTFPNLGLPQDRRFIAIVSGFGTR